MLIYEKDLASARHIINDQIGGSDDNGGDRSAHLLNNIYPCVTGVEGKTINKIVKYPCPAEFISNSDQDIAHFLTIFLGSWTP